VQITCCRRNLWTKFSPTTRTCCIKLTLDRAVCWITWWPTCWRTMKDPRSKCWRCRTNATRSCYRFYAERLRSSTRYLWKLSSLRTNRTSPTSWLWTVCCCLFVLHFYLGQEGNVFARLCLFVCLSVCLCVSKITRKVMDGSFWNFEGMSGMAQTSSDSILGWSERNPGFWITLKVSLLLLSMGHKGNRCKTEDGAAI